MASPRPGGGGPSARLSARRLGRGGRRSRPSQVQHLWQGLGLLRQLQPHDLAHPADDLLDRLRGGQRRGEVGGGETAVDARREQLEVALQHVQRVVDLVRRGVRERRDRAERRGLSQEIVRASTRGDVDDVALETARGVRTRSRDAHQRPHDTPVGAMQRDLEVGLRVARSVANLEVALHRPNRSVVWVLMSVARTGTDASSGLEGYIVDITARRRADDLLRETAALRSVAALANAAAHEINNSLNVLKGNLQLLTPRVDGGLAAAHLAPALAAAKAIEEIVGRMSQIMRLELTEQSETLPEMLDLRRSASAPPAPESPGR